MEHMVYGLRQGRQTELYAWNDSSSRRPYFLAGTKTLQSHETTSIC